MRHLLFQLLSQQKHLLPSVFAARWKHILGLSTQERIRVALSWELKELKDALCKFIEHTADTAKICLFIDGLDEFAGNHAGIISFLRDTVSSPSHVKVCLSSCPFPVFREAFQENPKLELHVLIHEDMLHYINDRLDKHLVISDILAHE